MKKDLAQRLTPLKDFPGCYIDLETHEVWSYVKHHTHKEPYWNKLKVRSGRSKHPCVGFTINHKDKMVIIAKLVLSAQSGVSYYDIPSCTHIFTYNQDRTIDIQSKSEERINWWAKRRKESHDYKIQDTERHIHVLRLLLKAYKGDARPLLAYVAQKKDGYLETMRKKGYSLEKSEYAYNVTLDRMIGNMDCTACCPYNFDGWFVKTMIGNVKNLYKLSAKKVDPETLPWFR